jgi:CARDB/Right handed beta helix region
MNKAMKTRIPTNLFLVLVLLCLSVWVFGQTVNHPYNNGPVTYTVSSGASVNYYDNGGPEGSYSDYSGSLSVLTFVPSSPSAKIQVVFTGFGLESCCDNMIVYDGLTTSAPQIGTGFTGNTAPNNIAANTVRATGPTGALTFVFLSDNSVVGNWQAIVTAFCSTTGVNNAGIIGIDTFTNFCAGTKPIFAKIENQGSNVLSSATLNWTFDGVVQAAVSYSGSLDTCGGSGVGIASVLLGTKSFITGEPHTITSWTSLPNGLADSQTMGDTLSKTVSAGLSGVYTIGGASPSYATFTEAVTALTQYGICAPVTFNVRNGTYNEQVNIGQIPGADSLKQITFQSESGDSSLAVLVFAASLSNTNYTVQLNGADWVTFNKLTIEGTGASYCRAVAILGAATHNTIRNCQLKGTITTSTSDIRAVLYMDGASVCSHNRFLNNYIRNGSFGLYLYGNSSISNYTPGTVVSQNLIENAYYMGCYLYYHNACLIEKNTIQSNSNYSSQSGINATYCVQNSRFLANNISMTGTTSGGNGMYLQYCSGNGSNISLVANNYVFNQGSNTFYGLYCYQNATQQVAHNTVRLIGSGISNRCFYNYYGDFVLFNNLFANMGGGVVMQSEFGISSANNNNYFSSGAVLFNRSSINYATLGEWQTVSLLDANSQYVNPQFSTTNSFPASNVFLNATATPLPSVTTDIEGETRNATTPDIGCDEFTPPANDASMSLLLSPKMPFSAGTQPVKVVLLNNGASALTSVTIAWKLNGISQTNIAWTGNLLSGDTAHVVLASSTFVIATAYNFQIWSQSPNSTSDANTLNDTLVANNLYAGLSGTYTIGGTTPDFATFSTAVSALNTRGVVGNVIFSVRNGTYTEQITINQVLGADSLHTIKFMSETGDSSLVKLTFSANSTSNFTVRLNNADWLTFEKLTLESTNTSYGRVLVLENGASHNTFKNCVLKGVITTSTGINLAVVYSPNLNNLIINEYNQFSDVYIRNGSYGILYEGGTNNNNYTPGVEITNSLVENAYYQSLYFYYLSDLRVDNNVISSSSNYSSQYGIDMYACNGGLSIRNNRVFLTGATSGGYGIYMYDCIGVVESPIVVANNYIFGSGTNTMYGVQSYYGSNHHFLYNTVRIQGSSINNRCYYGLYGNGKVLKNNNFANFGGAPAVSSYTGLTASSNNNFYSSGPILTEWQGTAYPTLATWQAITALDENSISVNPAFLNSTGYQVSNVLLNNMGSASTLVGTDIEGETRHATTPDIGCDEFTPPANDAALTVWTSPLQPFAAGSQSVKLMLKNNGSGVLNSASLHWTLNGVSQTSVNFAGALASGESTEMTLGTVNFIVGTVYNLVAWSSSPNNNNDAFTANDTITNSNLLTGMSGAYTIGGSSPDFANFTSAVSALHTRGVVGAVTFNVRNGIYTEQISINHVVGADSIKTVTFQSESGDSSLLKLTFSANSTSNFTLRLNGSDWLTFYKISIEATNTTYGRVVEITNGSTHNAFSHNLLKGVTTTSAGDSRILVYSPNTYLNEYNHFSGNHFLNGSSGLWLDGNYNNNNYIAGTEIVGNRFENQYYRGIYCRYQSGLKTNKNIISTASTYTSYQGILYEYANKGGEVIGNKVSGAIGGQGLYFYEVNGEVDKPFLVANNFIQIGGANTSHGIYNYYGLYHRIYHNSIHITGTNTGSSAYYNYYGENKQIKNNLLINTSGGYAFQNVYWYTSSSDYNNLYTTGTNLASFSGQVFTNLAAWQVAGFDVHGLSLDPLFTSTTDLHITNVVLDQTGTPLLEVNTDFDGETRDPVKPDMGADEFITSEEDAGIAAIQSPVMPFASGSHLVKVKIFNNGLDTLQNVMINWSINGVPQAPLSWSGVLLSGQAVDSVQVGTFVFQLDTMYTINVWTSLPNGNADLLTYNDTSSVTNLYAALGGIYTIGGTTPDFVTFQEAITALGHGGVIAPVVFNVRDGLYNESITINPIVGSNVDRTITFQSESGDSSTVILTGTSSYVLTLNGADWIRFNKLSIQVASGYYDGVFLTNGANNNRFEHCQFLGQTYGGYLIYSGSSNDFNTTLTDNRFVNANYGVYLNGNSSILETGNTIINNRFESQTSSAVVLYYITASSVFKNTITASSLSYGVSLNYSNAIQILNNTITGLTSGYGVYLYSCDNTVGNETVVANNFIQIGSGNSTAYGIVNYYSDRVKVLFNNVHINSTNASQYAMYHESAASCSILNNVFANTGGGRAIYISGGTSIQCDYNDLFSVGVALGNWQGASMADLATWKTTTTKDVHSVSENPLFDSVTDLHVTQSDLNNAGTPVSGFATDYDGDLRHATTPDIGADEFIPTGYNDAGVEAILSPNAITPIASGANSVEVVIQNNGVDTINSVTIQWRVNNEIQTPYAWTGTLLPTQRDTIVIGSYNFGIGLSHDIMALTENPDGLPDSIKLNDTASVLGLYAALNGVYTIGGAVPDFSTFSTAVTALNKGGVLGPVVFNIRNGNYAEGIIINTIKGGNAINTVLFQSESQDSTAVTLVNNAYNVNTITLDGADYVTFKYLTIQRAYYYGAVVELRNGANHIGLYNNRLRGWEHTQSLVVSNSGSLDNFTIISNNQFEDGDYGVYLVGIGSTTLETGAIIENNTFIDNTNGIYVLYHDAPKMNNNQLDVTGYGIYAYYCRNAVAISSNRITSQNSSGIYLYECNGTATQRCLVSNNFVTLTGTNGGQGINTSYGSFTNIHFNSVHVINTNANSYALYTYAGSNKNLLNNIFANMGGGYAIYASSSGIANSNFNDLFATGTNFGYWNGTIAVNLTAYRNASGKETNSLSVNPLFIADDNLHIAQSQLDSAGTGATGILVDFDGEIRSATYPDIGADEIAFLPDDIGAFAVIAPASDCAMGNAEPVTIRIQNYSSDAISGFSVVYRLDNGPIVTENVGPLSVPPGGTADFTFATLANLSVVGTHQLVAYSIFSADINHVNDTIEASIIHTGLPGVVSNMIPSNGTIGLPKDVTFTWSPILAAEVYDLYIWPVSGSQPLTPTVSSISQVSYYFYGYSFFTFGASYHWRIIARNDYCATPGPVQTFTIQNLPDLVVNNVIAPANAFSSQPITVSWQVANIGTGNTNSQTWNDAIYLSDDAILDYNVDIYLGGVSNFAALNPGQNYPNSATFTLPNGVNGAYFVFVVADRYGYMTESNETNNHNISGVSIITLTPPPDLRVSAIVPPNNAFSGTPISVNWTVKNFGTGETPQTTWYDRVWLSPTLILNSTTATHLGDQYHSGELDVDATYGGTLTSTIPQGINGTYYVIITTDFYYNVYEHANEGNNTTTSTAINVILTPPTDLQVTAITAPTFGSNKESVAVTYTVSNNGGSSASGYWYDNVYLSSNGSLTTFNSAILLGSFARPNDLGSGDSYSATHNVNLPDAITGNNYIYVVADAGNNIFEHTYNNNNHLRATNTTNVRTPNLATLYVNKVGVPVSGDTILATWTVKNIGTGKMVNAAWVDKIFISSATTFNINNVTLIASLSGSGNILNADSLNRQLNVILPNGITGQYYLYVFSDANANVYENNIEANNVNTSGHPLSVSLAPYVNLTPTNITALGNAPAGAIIPVSYAVKNIGTTAANALFWKDKIYIANSPTWSAAAQLLRTEIIGQSLMVDSSYVKNVSVTLPANLLSGNYYLFIITDDDNTVYEFTGEGNNRLASSAITVTGYPSIDLATNNVTAPAMANSGQNITVNWVVKNIALVATISPSWSDGIYLSTDSLFSPDTDILLGTRQQSGPIQAAANYSVGKTLVVPNGVSGTYYIIVRADVSLQNSDSNFANNSKTVTGTNGSAQTIVISLTPPPDLVVSAFAVPIQGQSGQPISVSWSVSNNGMGAAIANWADRFYLSTDFTLDNSDVEIGTIIRSVNLPAGQSYSDTSDMSLPNYISGNRIVLLKTDYQNTVYEHNAENNNVSSASIFIVQPSPSDLVVTEVVVPINALAGESINISWSLKNEGANPASGYMKDAVFLSPDPIWDATDVLLGTVNPYINLAPQATQNRNITANLTGVEVNDYYAIIRTDILDNINESNDTNNIEASNNTIDINVPELPIGLLTPALLLNNQQLYYRIEVLDSLAGESMMVTLKGDSINGNNQMYLRFGTVPTLNMYDFSYETPLYGNQEIIIPALQVGTYYLLAYGSTPTGNLQNITLLARKLNFEVSSIDANFGGNIGNVTTDIRGAKFEPSTVFKLINGSTDITGVIVQFVNPNKVYVKFNLDGYSLGHYDVVAIQDDGQTTSLAEAFEIVVGQAPQLAANILQPGNLRTNRNGSFTVDFANTGNVDIENAQLELSSIAGAPVSLNVEGLEENLTSLMLPLQIATGPANVLPPGQGGSIVIYTKSVSGLGFLLILPDLE